MKKILLRDAVLRDDFPDICRHQISSRAAFADISDSAAVCLAFLEHVNGGFHHLRSLKVEGNAVKCLISDSISTADCDLVTRIALLGHAFAVRCELSNGGPGRLRIWATRRDPKSKSIMSGHPSLDDLKNRIDKMLAWEVECAE